MVLTKTQQNLGTVAALLGLVQGVAWMVMSLICIVIYFDGPPSTTVSESYMGQFNRWVYIIFLYADRESPPGTILTPDTFTIFMWMYLMIDVIWVVLSLLQLYWVRRHDSNPIGALKCWATNTIIISVLDFLLVVLIGVDYSKHCIPTLTESVCTNVVIPVLIIAARGFVLWFVNVIFAYVILQIAKTLHDEEKREQRFLRSSHIPRPTLQSPSKWSSQPRNANGSDYWRHNPQLQGSDPKTPPTSPYYTNPQSFAGY